MKNENSSNYWLFASMVATSTIVMFGLMYINTFQWEHVYWSETRLYMMFIMGAVMAVIMLGFMHSMYNNRRTNAAIYVGSALVFAAALFLLRSQTLVQDESWMRAMIPHHSIAILTSERAEINDVRVRELADEIIETQRLEISAMEWLLEDIAENGEVTTEEEAETRAVPMLEDAP